MNSRPNVLIVFVLLIAGLFSCEKGPTDALLIFKAFNSDLNQKKSHLISEYQVDTMSMVIETITIEKTIPEEAYGFENIEDSIAYWENMEIYAESIYGPYKIDLLQGTSEPSIDIIDIKPGLYNCIDARILNGVGDSICFYMFGKALFNDHEISFECKYSGHAHIEFINPDGFVIAQNKFNQIWVLTDINLLFNSLDLSTAAVDQDSVIRMNMDSNNELLNIIIENLESASNIGLDLDLDGQID